MEGFEDSEFLMPVLPRAAPLLDHFSALRDPRECWRVLYGSYILYSLGTQP